MRKWILLFILFVTPVLAAEDIYPFATPEVQQRFKLLTANLRCLVCQNQNISDSNAPLAADLREQVYQQIQNGLTDKEIIEYLVSRYGDFILYRPPFNAQTIGLWVGPFIFFVISFSYLIFYLRKKRRHV